MEEKEKKEKKKKEKKPSRSAHGFENPFERDPLLCSQWNRPCSSPPVWPQLVSLAKGTDLLLQLVARMAGWWPDGYVSET